MVGKKFKDLILGELANELIEELKKPVLKEGGAVRDKRRNADNGNKRVISVIFKNNL